MTCLHLSSRPFDRGWAEVTWFGSDSRSRYSRDPLQANHQMEPTRLTEHAIMS